MFPLGRSKQKTQVANMDRATAWAAFKDAGCDTSYAYPPEFVDSVASKHLAKVAKEKIENEKAPPKEKGKMMSKETARAIKNSKGEGTQKERAEKFNTSRKNVYSIDSGKTWAWIGRTEAEDSKPLKIKIDYKVTIANEASMAAYRALCRAQLYED